jgi:hypothetical protein
MIGNEAKQKAPRLYQSAHFLQVDMDVLELVHGNWKAACLFARILDMQQQSEDGWAYHSWPQWEAQYFSRIEVERCIPLLKPLGLKVEVRDHKGRLTRHYHVEIKELTSAVASLHETTKEENCEEPSQVNPAMNGYHPVENIQGEEKTHGVENMQVPCRKYTPDPVENIQGLLEGSDLINRSTEPDQISPDANASSPASANAQCPDDDSPEQNCKHAYAEDSQEFLIASYLYDAIKVYAPSAIPKRKRKTPGGLWQWCEDIRLLRQHLKETEPGITDHDIGRMINFIREDDFWPGVVHSAGNFRKNFPKIKAKYDKHQRGANGNGKGYTTSSDAAYSPAKITRSGNNGESLGILSSDPEPEPGSEEWYEWDSRRSHRLASGHVS